MSSTLRPQKTTKREHSRLVSVVLQYFILFAFWLILSGHYQAKYIIIGALAAGLVTFLTNDLFYSTLRYGEHVEIKTRLILLQLVRFLAYIPWLLGQIVLANIQVACLVINPKMPIEPVLFLFKTQMRKGMSQVTLANSITLTPGTITVSLENGNYIIHTLKLPLAQSLADAVMQNKVARVYLEKPDPAPAATRLVYSLEELKR